LSSSDSLSFSGNCTNGKNEARNLSSLTTLGPDPTPEVCEKTFHPEPASKIIPQREKLFQRDLKNLLKIFPPFFSPENIACKHGEASQRASQPHIPNFQPPKPNQKKPVGPPLNTPIKKLN